MNAKALATQTQLLLDVGERFQWDFVRLGREPVPIQPVRVGEWLIVPASQDSSPIPSQTMQRIQTIYREGIRPLSWVVVHEAPRQLPAPRSSKRTPILPYLALLGVLGFWLAGTLAIVDPILIAITPELEWVEIDRWINQGGG